MAIVVEHGKRKREILELALDVFIEQGYEDVTFQKIADRCGVTRTTLYLYFKNKREIFLWSIKVFTEKLETSLQAILGNTETTNAVKLANLLKKVVEVCEENKKMFTVILAYLMQLQKTGKDSGERVRRRIIRLRHMMTKLLIDGMETGEFKKQNVKTTNEMFYGIIEAAIFRLAVMNDSNLEEMYDVIDAAIEGIKN